MKTIAIFGYGYVSKFLIQEFSKSFEIILVSRSYAKKPQDAFEVITFGDPIPKVDGAISTVPPQAGIDPVLAHYQIDGWVGYCSSTGVYGDHNGEWVTEESACEPTSQRGKERLEIEQQWLKNPRMCILRLAGIYGPGRSAFEQLQHAQRIDKPGHAFSRIHAKDIARFTFHAFENALDGIYNLADNLPAPSRDVIEYASDLIGKSYPPLVPFDQATLSLMATEFYRDNKMVSNQKLKDTGFILSYPDYKAGLEKIARELR